MGTLCIGHHWVFSVTGTGPDVHQNQPPRPALQVWFRTPGEHFSTSRWLCPVGLHESCRVAQRGEGDAWGLARAGGLVPPPSLLSFFPPSASFSPFPLSVLFKGKL